MHGQDLTLIWSAPWLRGLLLYVGVAAPAHLLWEILQLPLYAIWAAPPAEKAFAIAHCTIGDAMIAAITLILALLIVGKRSWPLTRFWPVVTLTGVMGLGYTAYSEWLNVVVRASWTYSSHMPVIPVFGFELGLSPVLQWIVVPTVAFAIVRWRSRNPNFRHEL